MPDPLYILAEIEQKPEHFKDARQAIIGIMDQTRAESGCRSSKLLEAPDQTILYLFEEWQDQDTLDQHHTQPYAPAIFKAYEGWLAKPPRILPLHGVK